MLKLVGPVQDGDGIVDALDPDPVNVDLTIVYLVLDIFHGFNDSIPEGPHDSHGVDARLDQGKQIFKTCLNELTKWAVIPALM